jgi:peptidylprolyl isomerase
VNVVRARLAALAVVPLILLAACGGNGDEEADSTGAEGSLANVSISGDVGAAPEVSVTDKTATETSTAVITEGDGPEVSNDGQSLVHLSVFSGKDGEKIYSSWDTEQPIPQGPDAQEPVPGLTDAIDGQPRGSRIAMEFPADKALNPEGLDKYKLEADDAVIVVVDVVSVQPTDALDGPEGTPADPPADAPGVVEENGDVTGIDWSKVGAKPKDLQVITLVEGEGPAIEKGRLATFDYYGEVWKGTKPFDESYSKEPITFPVGTGGLIPAWDKGLVGVKEGSRVMIIAPPDDAYGAEGRPPDIPANSTLVFVLDVLGVDG